MIFSLVWSATTGATIRDIASVIVALILSYIGVSAKIAAHRNQVKQNEVKSDQDRLDAGLSWERQQRISERQQFLEQLDNQNKKIWSIETELRACEKDRSVVTTRLESLTEEFRQWKSSQTRKEI